MTGKNPKKTVSKLKAVIGEDLDLIRGIERSEIACRRQHEGQRWRALANE